MAAHTGDSGRSQRRSQRPSLTDGWDGSFAGCDRDKRGKKMNAVLAHLIYLTIMGTKQRCCVEEKRRKRRWKKRRKRTERREEGGRVEASNHEKNRESLLKFINFAHL
ncbi:hypothetical protein V1478_013834 [Vespula squamosa]|uniref:Uncharacterized protein n=1 Tax=Vespula squamosa TaxID=30214 RepID=A0ABD2A696_VESSQ